MEKSHRTSACFSPQPSHPCDIYLPPIDPIIIPHQYKFPAALRHSASPYTGGRKFPLRCAQILSLFTYLVLYFAISMTSPIHMTTLGSDNMDNTHLYLTKNISRIACTSNTFSVFSNVPISRTSTGCWQSYHFTSFYLYPSHHYILSISPYFHSSSFPRTRQH